ncbi:MAG: hypothetical protein COU35_04145 [Candidatus Magasanikbacteria bacterium CG10_big_fil_rev_8_21_14_0_10_47_10]|uniref:Uncharacterized protein n=1 Tax=Candidatus Magasanikbacteria bacterium CG10_big_fil_rev_8_21_14_0_10_47_10 TaxID=1974652 RepID=A0A2H0TPN2_9BACT|nr:MAG: hypothetical protein COU35_04145 [Candidatus Magasanikbacteria bacterium CG10_big_fil_rev_8_21_14_0_10_47_10]
MNNLVTKKIMPYVLSVTILCAALLLFVRTASAQDYRADVDQQLGAAAGAAGSTFSEARDPRLIASLLIRYALGFLGIGFLGYTVYAGYIWMTAAGEEEKITKAKDTLRRTTIGLAIILSAYAITSFVTSAVVRQVLPTGTGVQFEQRPLQPRLDGDPLN